MNPNLPDEVLGDTLAVSLARVMAAANKRAQELGVKAGDCLITITQDAVGAGTRWRVNYGARDPVGRRGGDLMIDIDPADCSVARVLRGQ